MKPQFQLKNAVLLMALAAAYPLQSYAAPAGVAQFASGDVTVRRGAGADPLTKGKDIESGDAIVTGPNGRAQVRFSDGGLISLQPNSNFKIDNYADKGDPKEDHYLVNLLTGGMRAITGLIGKRNHDNYKVTTTTATIGIRGSGFNLAYNADGSLGVTTEIDEIVVCTTAGCVGLTKGESALVTDPAKIPARTSRTASIPTPEPVRPVVVVGDQVTVNGVAATVPLILAGTAISTVGVKAGTTQLLQPSAAASVNGAFDQRTYLDGALLLNPDGTPEYYLAQGNAAEGQRTGVSKVVSTEGSLTGGDLMMLATLSEGTWTNNPKTANPSTVTLSPVALVAGTPTTSASLAGLVGKSATYSLSNATPVFATIGASGTLQNTSKLMVDFGSATNAATVNLDILFGTNTTYNLHGAVSGTGAGFAGDVALTGSNCLSGGCGATGSVSGFFGGAGATRAGLSYDGASAAQGLFGGAATFTRGDLTTTAPPTVPSVENVAFAGTGFYTQQNVGEVPQVLVLANTRVDSEYSPSGTLTLTSGTPTAYSYENGTGTNNGTATLVRQIGTPGSSDYLALGYWSDSTWVKNSPSATTNPAPFAFVTGAPTSPVPPVSLVGRRAEYTLTDATPVFSSLTGNGTLLGTSKLSVDFNSVRAYADISLDVQFPTTQQPSQVSSTNYIYKLRGGAEGTGAGFSATNLAVTSDACVNGFSNCGIGYANGIISGANAAHIGLSFGATTDANGTWAGAGLFGKTTDAAIPTNSLNNGMQVALLDSGTFNGSYVTTSFNSQSVYRYDGISNMLFTGEQLTGITNANNSPYVYAGSPSNSYNSNAHYENTGSTTQSYGSVGKVTDSDFIGWGSWTSATGYNGSSSINATNVHYLAGRPTPITGSLTSMTGTYTMLGGTAPTSSGGYGGSSATGKLISATLTADFSAGKAGASVVTQFAGNNYGFNFSTTDQGSVYINNSKGTFGGQQSCGGAIVNGIFTGTNATRAGMVYQFNSGSNSVGTVAGAVGFARTGLAASYVP